MTINLLGIFYLDHLFIASKCERYGEQWCTAEVRKSAPEPNLCAQVSRHDALIVTTLPFLPFTVIHLAASLNIETEASPISTCATVAHGFTRTEGAKTMRPHIPLFPQQLHIEIEDLRSRNE